MSLATTFVRVEVSDDPVDKLPEHRGEWSFVGTCRFSIVSPPTPPSSTSSSLITTAVGSWFDHHPVDELPEHRAGLSGYLA